MLVLFLIRGCRLHFVFLFLLILDHFVLKASPQVSMLLFGTSVSDGRVAVQSDPTFYFVSLRVEEVEDTLHSCFFREHLVMFL